MHQDSVEEGLCAGGCRVGVGTRTLPCVCVSFSSLSATGRNPTPLAGPGSQKGAGSPSGSFSKSRRDLRVVRDVTEVVLWGRGLPACKQACKHLSGKGLGVGSWEEAESGAAEAGGKKMAREAAFLRDLDWLGRPPTEQAGTEAREWGGGAFNPLLPEQGPMAF